MRTTTVMLLIIIVLVGLNMVTAISLIRERAGQHDKTELFTIIDGKLKKL